MKSESILSFFLLSFGFNPYFTRTELVGSVENGFRSIDMRSRCFLEEKNSVKGLEDLKDSVKVQGVDSRTGIELSVDVTGLESREAETMALATKTESNLNEREDSWTQIKPVATPDAPLSQRLKGVILGWIRKLFKKVTREKDSKSNPKKFDQVKNQIIKGKSKDESKKKMEGKEFLERKKYRMIFKPEFFLFNLLKRIWYKWINKIIKRNSPQKIQTHSKIVTSEMMNKVKKWDEVEKKSEVGFKVAQEDVGKGNEPIATNSIEEHQSPGQGVSHSQGTAHGAHTEKIDVGVNEGKRTSALNSLQATPLNSGAEINRQSRDTQQIESIQSPSPAVQRPIELKKTMPDLMNGLAGNHRQVGQPQVEVITESPHEALSTASNTLQHSPIQSEIDQSEIQNREIQQENFLQDPSNQQNLWLSQTSIGSQTNTIPSWEEKLWLKKMRNIQWNEFERKKLRLVNCRTSIQSLPSYNYWNNLNFLKSKELKSNQKNWMYESFSIPHQFVKKLIKKSEDVVESLALFRLIRRIVLGV
ncbi:hypothetical protein CROQUDRAFT_129514 [Cronartium quercuum f. sp. fusiforme G11]|uniref:Uncharacterized protein n=1 Tax=Cronartium quercuum f. sp. fusiforme G11 TaxID=708437 RepID=A0A9P6NSE0_9BASI|nr:hypothetical protein CROQUDRAFT_129514 [Cronartium quercuum f. sp. fusiforme G11]